MATARGGRAAGRGGRLLALGVLALAGLAGRAPDARAAVTGVVYNPANGHWYKFVAASGTWSQAKTGAEGIGGYLVSLTSQAETDFVIQTVGIGGNSIWLGGTDETIEGTWVWIGGDAWSWANWNAGEPNNSGNEDYLMMYTTGKWNDANGTYTLPGYVVEWNSDPNPPPPPVLPPAPTNLAAVLAAYGAVDLAWTDNSANEQSFTIERKSPSSAFALLATVAANTTAYEDETVLPLVDYTYRVRAVNSVGPSGWTNESTVTSGPYVPAPLAPSNLVVTATTPYSVDLRWDDNSLGEKGFALRRRNAQGGYDPVATTGPDVTTLHVAGLSPDAPYTYSVFALGALRNSGAVMVATSTPATLGITTVKGDLKDSPSIAKDVIKLSASFEFVSEDSDGEADPVAEGFTLRIGSGQDPVTLSLPPNATGWKAKGSTWTWKSPKGGSGKYKITVDVGKRLLVVSMAGLEMTPPAENTVRVSLAIGDDAGTEIRVWTPQKKPGILRIR